MNPSGLPIPFHNHTALTNSILDRFSISITTSPQVRPESPNAPLEAACSDSNNENSFATHGGPSTCNLFMVAAAAIAQTTSFSVPGSAPPLSPRLLFHAVPQLLLTAARTLWQTSSALLRHLIVGPPHESFTWQATAVRAMLRTAMEHNPPAYYTSFVLARRFTQFTYPTSPHRFAFRPIWFVFDQPHKPQGSEASWVDSFMTTPMGQTPGYAVSGELVVGLPRRCEIDTLILYVHGGAFHFLSARTHRCITSKLVSYASHTCVLAIHQRLAPEHSFAAAVEDVFLVFMALIGLRPASRYSYAEHPLANLNAAAAPPDLRTTVRNASSCGMSSDLANRVWRPNQIIFAGDSSGGNTATSAVLVLKHFGLPLPGGLILLSPWLDPSSTSQSWIDNGHTCYLPADLPGLLDGILQFCKPLPCTHPFVSPLYATREMLGNLPPILVQVGGGEALYDEAIEWGECIARVGGRVRIEVFDGLFHVFQAFKALPTERHIAFTNISCWLAMEAPHLRAARIPDATSGNHVSTTSAISSSVSLISPCHTVNGRTSASSSSVSELEASPAAGYPVCCSKIAGESWKRKGCFDQSPISGVVTTPEMFLRSGLMKQESIDVSQASSATSNSAPRSP